MDSPHTLLKLTVTLLFIYLLISSAVAGESSPEKMIMVGSKPPKCVNKCLSCRPCMATLVMPDHHERKSFKALSRGEDDTYYLLRWKCRCGNKLYQP